MNQSEVLVFSTWALILREVSHSQMYFLRCLEILHDDFGWGSRREKLECLQTSIHFPNIATSPSYQLDFPRDARDARGNGMIHSWIDIIPLYQQKSWALLEILPTEHRLRIHENKVKLRRMVLMRWMISEKKATRSSKQRGQRKACEDCWPSWSTHRVLLTIMPSNLTLGLLAIMTSHLTLCLLAIMTSNLTLGLWIIMTNKSNSWFSGRHDRKTLR